MIDKFKQAFILVFLLISMSSLSACAAKIHYHRVPKPTLAQIRYHYVQQLRDAGVQVIQLGETMRFVLLSSKLFNPDSANVRNSYRPVLRTLAKLLRLYDKVNVKIAAYTDNGGEIKRQQALTTRQAQVVASFLWACGIDARLEYAVGYNRQNPVGWNGSLRGRNNNRRVEISFRFYPETIPYS